MRGKIIVLADDKEYTVPPLTFRQLRDLDTEIKALDTKESRSGVAFIENVVKIVGPALHRNHPEAEPEDLLDMSNAYDALWAALGIDRPARTSNVVSIDKAKPGEASGQGADAGSPGRASTAT